MEVESRSHKGKPKIAEDIVLKSRARREPKMKKKRKGKADELSSTDLESSSGREKVDCNGKAPLLIDEFEGQAHDEAAEHDEDAVCFLRDDCSKFSELDDKAWVLANTKACPKCRIRIQKDEGCKSMKCSCCGYKFCWICLSEYKPKGGPHACGNLEQCMKNNKSEVGSSDSGETRFRSFYIGFAANRWSRDRALDKLKESQRGLETLCKKWVKEKTELNFIVDAWVAIVECRRILMRSYTYGFCHSSQFKFSEQALAEPEARLDTMEAYLDDELVKHMDEGQKDEERFNLFSKKLPKLTAVTRDFFQRFAKSIENV